MTETNPGGSDVPRSNDIRRVLNQFKSHGDAWSRYDFLLPLCRGARVLELGCGYGMGALRIAPHSKSYLGVDPELKAIEWARTHVAARVGNARFLTLNEFSRQDADGLFDVGISFEVIEHVVEPESHLISMKNAVRPKGWIALSTPNGEFSAGRPELFRSPFHLREYSTSELSTLLARHWPTLNFFREFRVDHLDVIEFSSVAKFKDTAARPASVGNSPKYRAGVIVRDFVSRFLSYPLFWRIEQVKDLSAESRTYSTVIVLLRN